MKLHFIALGGSVMHNLAIALHMKGHHVTGSDDEIFEPSRSRLEAYGLLPEKMGWDPARIHAGLDAVILGMHAKEGNPELERAREMELPIHSFPEFLYEQSIAKKRIVIGGSHGKTTITGMIMHVLKEQGMDFNYLVGSQIEGFEVMVRLSDQAPVMIFEGDEYLTSALDPRPKFHIYRPHIALISGIAWDHINVFGTFQEYLDQFRIFIEKIEPGGVLVHFDGDKELRELVKASRSDIAKIAYTVPPYRISDGKTLVRHKGRDYPLLVFGDHNLANLQGAIVVCSQLGIPVEKTLEAMTTFRGAARRLELVNASGNTSIYSDFAHAPSKLSATIDAVKKQYPQRRMVACMELHTYSSLSKIFLSHYNGTMDKADVAVVYFNPHAIKLKKLPSVTHADILSAFGTEGLYVFDDSHLLRQFLVGQNWNNSVLLMMSSGNFDGMDLKRLAQDILPANE